MLAPLLVTVLAVLLTACGSGVTTPDLVEDGDDVYVISMTDFAFTPSTITIPASTPVVFRLRNEGAMLHDLDHTFVEPGETGDMPVVLAAGEHEMICTIPGHVQSGMALRVIAR
jgi:uncharacterized cupredoxin-like copper-binding protein